MSYYLIIMNMLTFFLYGLDKKRAKKRQYRIPESTLLLLAFCGGSIGALLGMKVFHHKTKHWKFVILIPIFLLLQIGLLIMFR